MVSISRVHFIESHWNSIAKRALSRIHREVQHSETIPDRTIMDRVEDLFGHVGDWLSGADPSQMAQYEEFGRARAAGGAPLHTIVRMLQIIRQCAVDYIREMDLEDEVVATWSHPDEHSFALQAENELEHEVHKFFDLVIYNVVKGYESALRPKLAQAAHAS